MNAQTLPTTAAGARPRVNRKVQGLPPSGIRKFFDLVANTAGVVSLGVGEPDFTTPWHICDAGIQSLEIGHTSYTSNNGLPVLRAEIADFIRRSHGCAYDPGSEVLVTVGGSEALDLVFRALLEPGDEAIVIDPSFVSYAPLVTLAGGVPVRVPAPADNGFVPPMEALEAAAASGRARAILVNYPNNPTGAAITPEQARAIADFAIRHDLVLISDEIYVPLSYEDEGVSFTAIEEVRDRLVLIHGFSKAWAMTGWRLGFACGPADIIGVMGKIHQYSIMCASTPAQHAAIEALRRGGNEVETMRSEYDRRRRYITHHFNRIGLVCPLPKGAFYAFPSVRASGLGSEAFALELLRRQRVAVVPGNAFGECGEGHIRCSFANSMDELRKAVERIERFLSEL